MTERTDILYAYTGASNGRTHLAMSEAWQNEALCGVDPMALGVRYDPD